MNIKSFYNNKILNHKITIYNLKNIIKYFNLREI